MKSFFALLLYFYVVGGEERRAAASASETNTERNGGSKPPTLRMIFGQIDCRGGYHPPEKPKKQKARRADDIRPYGVSRCPSPRPRREANLCRDEHCSSA